MAREVMSRWDRELSKHIHAIKRSVKALHKMGLKIEVSQNVETMLGGSIDHVYVIDRARGKIILQKYLFSV
jgi:predicted transcriptional regulator